MMTNRNDDTPAEITRAMSRVQPKGELSPGRTNWVRVPYVAAIAGAVFWAARRITAKTRDAAVKGDDQAESTNSCVVLDIEDMGRRCDAHDRWMQEHPDAICFSEAWADRNLDELTPF